MILVPAWVIVLVLAAGVIVSATIGAVLRPSKRAKLIVWILFGLSDFVVFGILILGLDYDIFTMTYVLLAFKNSIVVTGLIAMARDDIKLKGWHPWKHSW